jgi:hypothetical protein
VDRELLVDILEKKQVRFGMVLIAVSLRSK